MANELLFGNDAGAASASGTPYEKDVFPDVSLKADVNTGLTDNALTNPTGALVGNPDTPAYQAKTLLIKDLVLIEDRTKWIGQKPTYEIVFKTPFPAVRAYAFGSFTAEKCATIAPFSAADSELTRQRYLKFAQIGDGVGVTGKIRRVQWLVQGDTATTATAMRNTDGVNTTNIDFSKLSAASDANEMAKFAGFVHEATNETLDLHDFQLVAQQQNTLKVIGLVVYYENTGANLEVFPGRTYVNKAKVETLAGATFAVPAFGSSMAGVLSFAKAALGYTLGQQDFGGILSPAVGNSGTNLVDVATGLGGSFIAGMGVIASQGTSHYVGAVRSVSTDTLTVFPTLGFGVSNVLYQSWLSGPTYPISQTLMALSTVIGATQMIGTTNPILDPQGRFALWGQNLGLTQNLNNVAGYVFRTPSGFLQIEGYFQAADVELLGAGERWHATVSINGIAMWGENAGVTGAFRRTLLAKAGNGWNSIVIAAGASMGNVQISKVNLYQSQGPTGITFGLLANLRVNQSPVGRAAQNATLIGLGMQRRVFADQLFLSGAWSRGFTSSAIGGVLFYGTSTNAALDFQYFGKDFALHGAFASGSTLTVDGVGTALNPGAITSVAGNGFHNVRLTCTVTAVIQAIDFFAPFDEVENRQNVYGAPKGPSRKLPTTKTYRYTTPGTYYLTVPATSGASLSIATVAGCGGGGGGGGGQTDPGGPGGRGGAGGGGSDFAPRPLPLAPGTQLTLVVGAKGLGGGTNTAGGDGTDTVITTQAGTELLRMRGGIGGPGGTSSTTSGAGKGLGGAGGTGGATSTAGAAGSNGTGYFLGGAAGSVSGNGGGSGGGGAGYGGSGGAGIQSGSPPAAPGAANNGQGYGAGGAGGGGGSNGPNGTGGAAGDGADGYLEISFQLGEFEQ